MNTETMTSSNETDSNGSGAYKRDSIHIGLVAGIIVAVLAGIIIVAGIAYVIKRFMTPFNTRSTTVRFTF